MKQVWFETRAFGVVLVFWSVFWGAWLLWEAIAHG